MALIRIFEHVMKKLAMQELKRKTPGEFSTSEKMPVVVVLDNIRSAYNVGSVFRTCDAFPVEQVFLCGITCFPPHKEIAKTALGAEDTVKWKYFKTTQDAIGELKKTGYKILATEQTTHSVSLQNNKLIQTKNNKIALVFGHEVTGVQQEILDLCDGCIEIPQGGTKHSLNIAVSTGVVLWEFYRNFISGAYPA